MKRALLSLLALCTWHSAVAFAGIRDASLERTEGKLGPVWVFERHDAYEDADCQLLVDIAVEGGGTNTRIQVVPRNPDEFADSIKPYKETEGSNINTNPYSAAGVINELVEQQLKKLVSILAEQRGLSPDESESLLQRTCYRLGMGLAGTEGGEKKLSAFFSALTADQRMQKAVLVSDAEIAWRSVFDEEGVVIIAGTGGVVLGRNKEGDILKASGMPAPWSSRPSGEALAVDYLTCLGDSVSVVNGRLIWLEGDGVPWSAGDHHSLFDYLLGQIKGFKALSSEESYTSERLYNDLLLGGIEPGDAPVDLSDITKLAKIIYDFAEINLPGNSEEVAVNRDSCSYRAVKRAAEDMARRIKSIDLARPIEEEGIVPNLPFFGLKYYVHGSLGQRLIVDMENGLSPEDMQDYFARRVKLEKPAEPLEGALKMLREMQP